MRFSSIAAVAAIASLAQAHPGHDLTEEILERRQFVNSVHRKDLSHCAEKLRARGVEARSIARRSAAVEEARALRGFSKKDLQDVLSESHNESSLAYTPDTDPSKLFSGNSSCLLTPEVTQGPYYVGGEFVRKDITDSQPGIDITLDYQVIDVDTCEPVPDVYIEIWHCNSTGVYSGVLANGNGNSNDKTNLDNTFLRGIQETDSDGVAQFKSIFPGHYTGRATHIHVMVHTNATLLANKTLGNDEIYASHVGQAFFDQDLITAVEKTSPYSTNTQELTENDKDDILAEEADDVDPFMSYVYLGDDLNSGLFAWIAFGINTSYSSHVTPAANYYEGGGVTNENAGMGGGPGGPGGPGGLNGTRGMPPGTGIPGATPSATASSGFKSSTVATIASTGGVGLATLLPYGAVAGGVGLAMLLQ